MTNKIEFIDNEDYCRYNGILCSPENMIEVFGADIQEICIVENHHVIFENVNEDTIIWVDVDSLYLAIELFIKAMMREDISYSYSNEMDEAHGFSKETIKKIVYVDSDFFKDLRKVRTLSDSKKRELKIPEFLEFQRSLNGYYKNTFKNSQDLK